MSLLLKSGSFLILGGGAGIIPFINSHTSSGNVSPTSAQQTVSDSEQGKSEASPPSSIPTPNPPVEASEESEDELSDETETSKLWNCLVTSGKDEVISKLAPSFAPYVSFSCDNSGRDDEVVYSKWSLWAPTKLLKEREEWFKEGQRADITTHTTSVTGNTDSWDFFETKFESESFSYPAVTGKWGGNILEDFQSSDNSQVYSVRITKPKLEDVVMYLNY